MQGAHLLILQEGEEQLQQKGFLSFWSNRRYEHAKALIMFILQEGEEQLQQKGFLSFWSNRRYEHAKALICLYCITGG
jgi:tRNA G10  N-methylase Trm11